MVGLHHRACLSSAFRHRNQVEKVKAFLDAGADPHAQNTSALTALEFTFMYANQGAEVLLQAGARLPKDKVESYLQTYGKNPASVKLIKWAADFR